MRGSHVNAIESIPDPRPQTSNAARGNKNRAVVPLLPTNTVVSGSTLTATAGRTSTTDPFISRQYPSCCSAVNMSCTSTEAGTLVSLHGLAAITASSRALLATDFEPGRQTLPHTGLSGGITETKGDKTLITVFIGTPTVRVGPIASPIVFTATIGIKTVSPVATRLAFLSIINSWRTRPSFDGVMRVGGTSVGRLNLPSMLISAGISPALSRWPMARRHISS